MNRSVDSVDTPNFSAHAGLAGCFPNSTIRRLVNMNTEANARSFKRSSFCSGGTCVEVAQADGRVLVRDSKDFKAQPLVFDSEEWSAFVQGVKAGEFDS